MQCLWLREWNVAGIQPAFDGDVPGLGWTPFSPTPYPQYQLALLVERCQTLAGFVKVLACDFPDRDGEVRVSNKEPNGAYAFGGSPLKRGFAICGRTYPV